MSIFEATLNKPAGGDVTIGDTVVDGTVGSVLFIAAGPVLAQDNTNFNWADGLNLTAPTATDIPLVVKAAAAQSADLSQWTDSSDAVGARITKDMEFSNSSQSSGAENEIFGKGAGAALTTGIRNTLIGCDTGKSLTTSSQNVIIGTNHAPTATISFERNVIIGQGNAVNATFADNTIAIGTSTLSQLTQGGNNIALGEASLFRTANGAFNIGIGKNTGGLGAGVSMVTGDYNILLGNGTGVIADTDNGIAIGRDTVTAANHFVSGSNTVAVSEVFFGEGIVDATPTAYTINGTGGSGTDIAGADIQIAGGKGTGDAAGGDILLQTADAGASGATLQSLTTKAILTVAGNFGVGVTTLLGRAHFDQGSTTAAIPTLYLDQADVSEEMIEFNTTIGTGNAIEAIAAKTLTTTHFIKVTIPGGLTRYIPCGTIA